MTKEQKQALINRCKNRIAFYKAAGNTGTFDADTLQLTEIALAALTVQPIKLPDYTPEVYPNHALENQKIKSRNDAVSDCADAIRAAGYEVQE